MFCFLKGGCIRRLQGFPLSAINAMPKDLGLEPIFSQVGFHKGQVPLRNPVTHGDKKEILKQIGYHKQSSK